MDDIARYHIIPRVPECFIRVGKMARRVAVAALMSRPFTNLGSEFWRTLRVISHMGVAGADYARRFVARNAALSRITTDTLTTDSYLLDLYTPEETMEIARILTRIPPCGVDVIVETYRHFSMTFSIWHAHRLYESQMPLADIKTLIRATLQHFPEIIGDYLKYMELVYGGGWYQHHTILTAAMEMIEGEYTEYNRPRLFAKIRQRIDDDIETLRTFRQDDECEWYQL